jgi:hypothetical protein
MEDLANVDRKGGKGPSQLELIITVCRLSQRLGIIDAALAAKFVHSKYSQILLLNNVKTPPP